MTNQEITYSDARANLAELLDRVSEGKEIIITRNKNNHKKLAEFSIFIGNI